MSGDVTLAREVRETLAIVLGRTFADDDPVEREGHPEWDSLKHVEVVFALEDELGVRFDAEELGRLASVRSIVEAVERHRAQ
jgi:acyl carrier protein